MQGQCAPCCIRIYEHGSHAEHIPCVLQQVANSLTKPSKIEFAPPSKVRRCVKCVRSYPWVHDGVIVLSDQVAGTETRHEALAGWKGEHC